MSEKANREGKSGNRLQDLPTTFDASQALANQRKAREDFIKSEITALYTPDREHTTPEQALEINKTIEQELEVLKAKCRSLAHGESSPAPVVESGQ
jgi:hypothetical protein